MPLWIMLPLNLAGAVLWTAVLLGHYDFGPTWLAAWGAAIFWAGSIIAILRLLDA